MSDHFVEIQEADASDSRRNRGPQRLSEPSYSLRKPLLREKSAAKDVKFRVLDLDRL